MRSETGILEVTTRVDAPPETVFAYFTDPERHRLWKGTEAELDPRPGGIYRIVLTPRTSIEGEYVLVEPPARLVMSWGWRSSSGMSSLDEVPPGSSTVEVTFTADGDGTLVRIRHSGLPGEESVAFHHWGWDLYLPRLSVAATGGDAGPDPVAAMFASPEAT